MPKKQTKKQSPIPIKKLSEVLGKERHSTKLKTAEPVKLNRSADKSKLKQNIPKLRLPAQQPCVNPTDESQESLVLPPTLSLAS